jgi:glutamyl-tRNA reductase
VALPRDVDAAVGAIKDVFVYNLDDLAKIAGENRTARESEIVRCRQILEVKAGALWAQLERAPTGVSDVRQENARAAEGFNPDGPTACVA